MKSSCRDLKFPGIQVDVSFKGSHHGISRNRSTIPWVRKESFLFDFSGHFGVLTVEMFETALLHLMFSRAVNQNI
jgi:hypothetical protein